MEERSYCHGLLYELGSLDHLSEADTKRMVIVDRIGVPVMALIQHILFSSRSKGLTSPSSEQVKKRLGDDSVTILFTRSACDL